MKLDIKGFFLGGLLALVGTLVVGIVVGILAVALGLVSESGDFFGPHLLILCIGTCLLYIWSGYIVARISKENKLFTAMAFSLVMLVFCFFVSNVPVWYIGVISLLCLPLHYAGAMVHIKRANKKRSKVDGSTEPPIAA